MTQDEIIRMAKNEYGIYAFTAESLAEFATIIAAAECEACAKVADEQAQDEPYGHAKFRCGNIAAAIRARSEQCG
jgi:hypothetical protein